MPRKHRHGKNRQPSPPSPSGPAPPVMAKLSRGEIALLLVSSFLSLASVRGNDPWVVVPMLVIAWIAFLYVCITHQGSKRWRAGAAIGGTVVLLALGLRITLAESAAVPRSTGRIYVGPAADQLVQLAATEPASKKLDLLTMTINSDPERLERFKKDEETFRVYRGNWLRAQIEIMWIRAINNTASAALDDLTYDNGFEVFGTTTENNTVQCRFTNEWQARVVQHRAGETVKVDGRILIVTKIFSSGWVTLGNCELVQ
jgi:hypothetical protein